MAVLRTLTLLCVAACASASPGFSGDLAVRQVNSALPAALCNPCIQFTEQGLNILIVSLPFLPACPSRPRRAWRRAWPPPRLQFAHPLPSAPLHSLCIVPRVRSLAPSACPRTCSLTLDSNPFDTIPSRSTCSYASLRWQNEILNAGVIGGCSKLCGGIKSKNAARAVSVDSFCGHTHFLLVQSSSPPSPHSPPHSFVRSCA